MEATTLTNIIQYKLGSLPMKYLGLHLHWKMPSKQNWEVLIEEIQKRLSIWKGRLLSLGGRLVLLNSMLSSLILYYMSMFKVSAKHVRVEKLKLINIVSNRVFILENDIAIW